MKSKPCSAKYYIKNVVEILKNIALLRSWRPSEVDGNKIDCSDLNLRYNLLWKFKSVQKTINKITINNSCLFLRTTHEKISTWRTYDWYSVYYIFFSLAKTLLMMIKLKNFVKNYESDEKSVQILSNANTAKTVTYNYEVRVGWYRLFFVRSTLVFCHKYVNPKYSDWLSVLRRFAQIQVLNFRTICVILTKLIVIFWVRGCCSKFATGLKIIIKGQLISKWFLISTNSSKKTNEWILLINKTTCFRSFFGRNRRNQKLFRNYLTFCQNDFPMGDHFGKRTLIYFLNYD